MKARLRVAVLLVLAFAAGMAAAVVLFKAPSRAPVLVQTVLNVLVLFMLFRIHRAHRNQARGVQQTADSILKKLRQHEPTGVVTEPRQSQRRPPDRIM